jgi:putative SOS response-associated peptidase YedK
MKEGPSGSVIKPINAKAETISRLPMFRDAYARRRCIVPVDGFFEWKAIKGQRAKQPFAIAMKDGSPFGIAGLWKNWKDPATDQWLRTFAIITVPANELVAMICLRSCTGRTTTGGLASSPILATRCGRSPPSC